MTPPLPSGDATAPTDRSAAIHALANRINQQIAGEDIDLALYALAQELGALIGFCADDRAAADAGVTATAAQMRRVIADNWPKLRALHAMAAGEVSGHG